MKRMFFLYLLFISFIASGQSDLLQIETQDSSAIPTPDGEPVKKVIGSTGGKIVSPDGRIELIFPSGALAANTTISIQPIKNILATGTGKGYSFEPSGIEFKKPVQIIFHYSDEENESCPAELMSIAQRDHKGKWSFFDYEDWDSSAKTLKGYVKHFSLFTSVNDIMISPGRRAVQVGDSVYIDVLSKKEIYIDDKGQTQRGGAFMYIKDSREWFVNGIGGGNDYEGKIKEFSLRGGKTVNALGTYYAPRYLPKKDPVTITLNVQHYSKKLQRKVWRPCHCKVMVYDRYRVSIVQEFTTRAGLGSKLIDSASFIVLIYPTTKFVKGNFVIQDIKNYDPVVLKEGRRPPFKEKISTEGALGTIHITEGIKNDSLSHDYPPEVYFEFFSTDILMCRMQITARGLKGTMDPVFSPSVPEEINFIANGKEQVYNVSSPNGQYKLIVKPLHEKQQ